MKAANLKLHIHPPCPQQQASVLHQQFEQVGTQIRMLPYMGGCGVETRNLYTCLFFSRAI